jgi:glycosyltransferase involved in cell wall biosynthesis
LPSLKDPSPLSPIEAIAAGLPILVSSRIGNLEDVLAEGINGWSYDPFDEINKGKEIVSKISNLKKEDFKKKGNASSNRYNLKFNTRDCIENNAKDLKEILKMA